MEPINYLWKDRKRYFGLPISFTRYRLSENRIFRETGLFNLKEEEVLLYRVRDPKMVKELIYQKVEEAKTARRMRATELVDDGFEPDEERVDDTDFCPME